MKEGEYELGEIREWLNYTDALKRDYPSFGQIRVVINENSKLLLERGNI